MTTRADTRLQYTAQATVTPLLLSDTSSDESLDLSRAFEGIKVRITNLPNHPVLDSVKRHAARAKERVGRSDTMLASPNGSLSAVDTTGATGGDDSTITRNVLSAGSGSGRNGIIRKPRARRQSIDLTEPSREPGTKEKEPTSGRDSDRDQQRARAMTPKPVSLLVVDEEGHEAEADYGPGASEGKARGRTLPDASDVGVDGTSRGASDLPSPASSPGISPTPSPSTLRALDSAMCLAPDANISRGSFSLMGGALHDEPEDHHHQPEIAYPQDSLYASRPQSREGFTRRPTSSSSSDLQNDGDSPPEEEGSDDEEGGAGGGPTSLNLEHGEPLTKKDLRRQLHRHKAIPPEAYPDSATYRAASIAHHVSRGLHYASSQSRNRRAMERYSPNPNRVLSPPQRHLSSGDLPAFTPLQMTATTSSNGGRMTPVPRSTTPGLPRDSIASSRRSSISDMDREAGGLNGTFSAVGSPTADDHDHWAIGALNLRRWGTGHASIASSRTGGAGRHYLHAPHVWQRRKRKQWGAVQVDDSPISTPKAADPEQELDKALGKLAAEQAPEEVGERYEFDVLYENQRG